MTISFDQIPVTLRTPGVFVEFDSSQAVQGLQVEPYRALLIAPRNDTGAVVAALTPTLSISDDQARNDHGPGSPLANMARAWRANNRFTETWQISIDTSAGTPSEYTLTCTGAAITAGTVYLYLGGLRITAAVADSASVTEVASAIAAAVEAEQDSPFSATSAVGVVTLEAKAAGRDADASPVVLNHNVGEALPSDLAIAVANSVPGVGSITLSDVITAIGEDRYHILVFPQLEAADYTALETELADRWGPIRQNDGHAFGGVAETVTNLVTAGGLRNSPHVTVVGVEPGIPNSANDVAAAAAAQVAQKGNIDPARPFQTLALVGILASRREDRFTLSEQDTLLHNGIATLYTDEGDTLRIQRMITNSQTNALALPDIAYLNVNTLLTLSLLRSTFRTRFATKFPRAKLVGDETNVAPGQATITPSRATAEAVAIFRDWEVAGYVENVSQFKADLVVERDETDPDQLNILLPPDLANQLRKLGVKLQFRLNS